MNPQGEKTTDVNALFTREHELRQQYDESVRDHGSRHAMAYDMETLAQHTAGLIAYGLCNLNLEPPERVQWLKMKVWAALQEQQKKNYPLQHP